MIPKKSLDSVLDQSIILTKTAPNDNAKSISVQCEGGQIMPTKLQQALPDFQTFLGPCFLFLNCPRLSINPSNFGDPIGTCTFFQVKKMRKESFA